MTDLVQLRRDEGVLTLLLNNPDRKNALTEAMIGRLKSMESGA